MVEVEHPRCGRLKVVGPAVVYDGERMKVNGCDLYISRVKGLRGAAWADCCGVLWGLQVTRAPPVLGEHTFEVLEELGYGKDEIAKFKADRVV